MARASFSFARTGTGGNLSRAFLTEQFGWSFALATPGFRSILGMDATVALVAETRTRRAR
jgi:hypothetical protein